MKKQKESEVVTLMISLYCKKKHGCNGELCADCAELLEYVKLRRNRCPWGDNKPFCSSCKIHCYIPKMRKSSNLSFSAKKSSRNRKISGLFLVFSPLFEIQEKPLTPTVTPIALYAVRERFLTQNRRLLA